MARWLAAMGWCAAMAAGFACWVLYRENESLRAAHKTIDDARKELETRVARVTEDLSRERSASAALEGRLNELETTLDELKVASAAPAPEPVAETPPVGPRLRLPAALPQGAPADDDAPSPLLQMAMSDEAIARSAGINLNMRYGELFTHLQLDAERADEIRAIIRSILEQQTRDALARARGGQGPQPPIDYDVWIREELAQVLTPQELAAFDEYQAGMNERIQRQSYDLQLTMFAPGLTPENRALALDVLVEETAIAQQEGTGRTVVYDRALERLAGSLDEPQYALFEGFVEQQRAIATVEDNQGDVRQFVYALPGGVRVFRTQTDAGAAISTGAAVGAGAVPPRQKGIVTPTSGS